MKENKSDNELLQEISSKLDKLIGVMATTSIKEPKNKIPILRNLGYTIDETAQITSLTIDVVKKAYSKSKKK